MWLWKCIPTASAPGLLSHPRQLQPGYQAHSLEGPYRPGKPSTPTAELQPRWTWADISHHLMTPGDVQDSMWPQDIGATCVWWPVVTGKIRSWRDGDEEEILPSGIFCQKNKQKTPT